MRKLFVALLLVAVILATAACGTADQNAQQATTAPTSEAPTTEPQTTTVPPTTEQPHEHSYVESKVAPTCTVDGYTLYSCSCGDSYKESPVPATGHTYTDTKTPPTCTEDGGTIHACSCGDSYKSDIVNATGHKWSKWNTVQEPTTAADGKAERTCSVCNETETKKLDKLVENHTHKYTEQVTKTATCTQTGVMTFTCSCGSSYTEQIAKKNHEYVKNTTVKPTCTDGGYTLYKCNGCAAEDKRDIKTATGHSYNAATCTEPETCKSCGTKKGVANGHKWNEATCTAAKTCSVCKLTNGSALGHNMTAATCTEPQTCSRCKTTSGSAKGHAWVDATCQKPKTCKTCKVTSGSPSDHNWQAATCTTAKTCKTCKTTSGSALGHSWKSATCTTPKTCSTCKKTEGSTVAHSLSKKKTVAPTCVDKGYDVYECKNCDYTEHQNSVAATGKHDMELTSNTATCTQPGVKTYKCKTCTKTTTESVPASGSHSMTTTTVAKAANKVNDFGNSALMKYRNMTDVNISYCSKCGYVDYDSVASIYTAAQETALMIDMMRGIRHDWIYEDLVGNGAATPEEAEEFINTYKHVSDKTAINHAIRRAKEISTDYSHNGAPARCAENISAGDQNWTEAFAGWKNSPEHYTNMIRWAYPYVGCSRYIVTDAEFETITIYYVAIFRYY